MGFLWQKWSLYHNNFLEQRCHYFSDIFYKPKMIFLSSQCLKFRQTTMSQTDDAAVRAMSLKCDDAPKRALAAGKQKSANACNWKYKDDFEFILSKIKKKNISWLIVHYV